MYLFDHNKLIQEMSYQDMELVVQDFDVLIGGGFLTKESILLHIVEYLQSSLAKENRYLALKTSDRSLAIQVANCCMRELLKRRFIV